MKPEDSRQQPLVQARQGIAANGMGAFMNQDRQELLVIEHGQQR